MKIGGRSEISARAQKLYRLENSAAETVIAVYPGSSRIPGAGDGFGFSHFVPLNTMMPSARRNSHVVAFGIKVETDCAVECCRG
jgi:hypothetical protein